MTALKLLVSFFKSKLPQANWPGDWIALEALLITKEEGWVGSPITCSGSGKVLKTQDHLLFYPAFSYCCFEAVFLCVFEEFFFSLRNDFLSTFFQYILIAFSQEILLETGSYARGPV